ncbi:hypothetical protein N783_17305 [Pontibacillus marinus BH030004 = DSM 16465]|uniref:Uncharacterized protein n=1 Tax=Pontibacillus marinus BH030004 = DSM 16465 TaxID=1385511 RepID=A0A0A5G0E5_9BACI|nr:hypothetical protein N783_17305 [Pontibacillus marinus BH030004 = DSM 16465]
MIPAKKSRFWAWGFDQKSILFLKGLVVCYLINSCFMEIDVYINLRQNI